MVVEEPVEKKAGLSMDEFGRVVEVKGVDGQGKTGGKRGGLMRGPRVKGVRDKRDKRGDGNGRRVFGNEEV